MNKLLLALFLSTSASAFTLKVSVENLQSNKGTIKYLIFNKEDGFPDVLKNSFKSGTILVKDADKGIVLESLEEGSYAVSIIHDENDNDKLDTNFMGIPKEGFGFSNNPRIYFGPPSFEKARVEVEKDTDINIVLKHF